MKLLLLLLILNTYYLPNVVHILPLFITRAMEDEYHCPQTQMETIRSTGEVEGLAQGILAALGKTL